MTSLHRYWGRTNKRIQLEDGPRAVAVVFLHSPVNPVLKVPLLFAFPHFTISPNQHMWSQWLQTTHTLSSINSSNIHWVPTKCQILRLHRWFQNPPGLQGALSITACAKGPHAASIGKINKFWGWRGSGIFLALLWLNVVPTSPSLTPMLVTGCRKVICAGEWHHFFLFLKKGIYASLPILKFCDCMILN